MVIWVNLWSNREPNVVPNRMNQPPGWPESVHYHDTNTFNMYIIWPYPLLYLSEWFTTEMTTSTWVCPLSQLVVQSGANGPIAPDLSIIGEVKSSLTCTVSDYLRYSLVNLHVKNNDKLVGVPPAARWSFESTAPPIRSLNLWPPIWTNSPVDLDWHIGEIQSPFLCTSSDHTNYIMVNFWPKMLVSNLF